MPAELNDNFVLTRYVYIYYRAHRCLTFLFFRLRRTRSQSAAMPAELNDGGVT